MGQTWLLSLTRPSPLQVSFQFWWKYIRRPIFFAKFHIFAGNSYLTFYNAAALGPKGIAKRAAKDTGKAFIGVDTEAVAARANTVPDQQNLVRTRFFCPHPYPIQTRLKCTHIFRQSEMFWTRRAVIHRGQSTKGEAGKASNIQMSSDDFSGWAMILKSLNDAGYIFWQTVLP